MYCFILKYWYLSRLGYRLKKDNLDYYYEKYILKG